MLSLHQEISSCPDLPIGLGTLVSITTALWADLYLETNQTILKLTVHRSFPQLELVVCVGRG